MRKVLYKIKKQINELSLNLSDKILLTEAATGPYIVTSIIGALAGAKVFAFAKDSRYGSAQDVFDATPSVDAGISLDNVAQDVLIPVLETSSFMASVKETVQVAAKTASMSIPVQSEDDAEAEAAAAAAAEVVEDFWF